VADFGSFTRDSTTAGPGTAPGRFGERLLREPIDHTVPRNSIMRAMPQRSTPDANVPKPRQSSTSTSARQSDSRSVNADRRAPGRDRAAGADAAPMSARDRSAAIVQRSIDSRAAAKTDGQRPLQRRRAAQPAPSTKLDRLRAFLETRGELPDAPTPAGTRGPDSSGATPRSPGSARTTRSPSSQRPADEQRLQRTTNTDSSNVPTSQQLPDRADRQRPQPGSTGPDSAGPAASRRDTARPGSGSFEAAVARPLSSTPDAGEFQQIVDVSTSAPRSTDRRLQRIISSTPLLDLRDEISAPTPLERSAASPTIVATDASQPAVAPPAAMISNRLDPAPAQAGASADRSNTSPDRAVQRAAHPGQSSAPNTFSLSSRLSTNPNFPAATALRPPGRTLPQLDGDTLRRVTLPRALSTNHRPTSRLDIAASMPAPADTFLGSIQQFNAAPRSGVSTPQSRVTTPQPSAASRRTETAPGTGHFTDIDTRLTPTQHNAAAAGPALSSTVQRSELANRSLPTEAPARPGVATARSMVVPAGTGALVRALRDPSMQPATTSAAHRSLQPTAAIAATSTSTSTSTLPADSSDRNVQRSVAGVAGRGPSRPDAVARSSAEIPSQTSNGSPSVANTATSNTAISNTSTSHSTSDSATPITAVAPRSVVTPEPTPLPERFLQQLASSVQRAPAPLPMSFQPMANEITGRRTVMLSTDTASRRALRSVGKVAATTGNTIHLDAAPTPGIKLNEIIAHELTHVAHPSATPRFFDDIDDSPEERKAEAVARVMARSAVAPSASTAMPSTGPRSAPGSISNVLRRTPAVSRFSSSNSVAQRTATTSAAAPARPSSGSVGAAELAAQITGTAAPVVQRKVAPIAAGNSASASTAAVQPAAGAADLNVAFAQVAAAMNTPDGKMWFRDQLGRNFDWLLREIEDRMIVDLERRGRRNWRGL